jgi:XTP/dITP diphosphohydrolase
MTLPSIEIHELVVATSNAHKLSELRALLAPLSLKVWSVAEVLGKPVHVVEDGATFVDNAVKKATEVAKLTHMLTLADDSGLEVDALDGAPGVRSARFSGERATDAENNAALLRALGELVEGEGRREVGDCTARFRCVLALVDPYVSTAPVVVQGACEGRITLQARGTKGFGYDPLFVVGSLGRTMAELSSEEKNQVSHRALAMRELVRVLPSMLEARAT